MPLRDTPPQDVTLDQAIDSIREREAFGPRSKRGFRQAGLPAALHCQAQLLRCLQAWDVLTLHASRSRKQAAPEADGDAQPAADSLARAAARRKPAAQTAAEDKRTSKKAAKKPAKRAAGTKARKPAAAATKTKAGRKPAAAEASDQPLKATWSAFVSKQLPLLRAEHSDVTFGEVLLPFWQAGRPSNKLSLSCGVQGMKVLGEQWRSMDAAQKAAALAA